MKKSKKPKTIQRYKFSTVFTKRLVSNMITANDEALNSTEVNEIDNTVLIAASKRQQES